VRLDAGTDEMTREMEEAFYASLQPPKATLNRIEHGLMILNRVCLHYLQNRALYDDDARGIVVNAVERLVSSGGFHEPEVSGIYFLAGDMKVKEKPCQLVDDRDKPPWKSKRTKAIRERNRTRRLAKLPKAFDMDGFENLLEWLQQNAIEGDAVYCSICRDYFPGTDDWNLCEHCWWCDKTGDYSTPSERCKCKDRDACRNDE
jgi:hypothetical protein